MGSTNDRTYFQLLEVSAEKCASYDYIIMTHRARSGSHLVKCIRRVLDFILELPILEFQSYRPYRLGKRRKICNFPLLHARAVIIVCAIVLFYTA